MHRERWVIGSMRSGVLTAGMLLCATWMQAWTGVSASGDDGDDADARSWSGLRRDAPVTGSGVPRRRNVAVPGVSVLLVDAGFSVRVRIGDAEDAIVAMDDNLDDIVESRVDGNQLRLGLRPRARVRDATLSAEVTLRYLEQITACGGCRVRIDSELVGDGLVLSVLGMSEVSGAIRVERVQAGISGASRLSLSGQVRRLGVAASGASELLLADLAVVDLDARLSGATIAEVTVRDTLVVQTSGASTLHYRGQPRIVRRQSTGASSVAPVG